jgi:hypothetical protein
MMEHDPHARDREGRQSGASSACRLNVQRPLMPYSELVNRPPGQRRTSNPRSRRAATAAGRRAMLPPAEPLLKQRPKSRAMALQMPQNPSTAAASMMRNMTNKTKAVRRYSGSGTLVTSSAVNRRAASDVVRRDGQKGEDIDIAGP